MSGKIKLYEYDYAAYFTGKVIEIDETQGYKPGYLTTVPVPEIPEGRFAKFNKSLHVWEIVENERPTMRSQEEIYNTFIQENLQAAPQTEPTVI
jgi:hypothetical protein